MRVGSINVKNIIDSIGVLRFTAVIEEVKAPPPPPGAILLDPLLTILSFNAI